MTMSGKDHGWNGTPVSITTPWGDTLTVLEEDASHYGEVLETGVSWAYETRYLAPYVQPGEVVVDVGANYGYTTCYFASVCGPSGHVLALEPEPETRALLEHNVRRNGYQNVEIVSAAAGATNGSISLWRSKTNFANHALNAGLVPNVRDSVQVDVVTVDDLCAARLGDRMPTVLKIDVEGWEWEVLDGAREVLDRARPTIWLEYWPDGIRANGHDPGEVLDLFDAYGYSVSAHDLVIESPVALTGRELIEYCDRAAERFRAAGRFGLHGILYLHAAQDPSPVPGRPTVEPH
jgi:FkbM family methyltransferase